VILSSDQRLSLLRIVSDVEEGRVAAPRVGGAIGRFLREIDVLRRSVQGCLPHDGTFVRGRDVGPIGLTPLTPVKEQIRSELVGEMGSAVAFSEELGGLVDVTLWAKAGSANRLRTLWLQTNSCASLTGAYRWFAPRRLTPGTAAVEETPATSSMWQARCLKFVADDFLSAPSAVTYRWDSFFGPPDFRVFRVVSLFRSSGEWLIVPRSETGLTRPTAVSWPNPQVAGPGRELALAMIVRDPWEGRWKVADAARTDRDGVLAHLITCADHRRELLGLGPPPSAEVAALRSILSRLGHTASTDEAFAQANLRREVAPLVRPLAAWTRGVAPSRSPRDERTVHE
jgi:hypothetical protein